MKMLKLSLLVAGILLLASHSSFAQGHIKIHSREQLETLNEQMCFYLEGHKPELSHTKLRSFFSPGEFADIEQPFESQGPYSFHLKISFCNSVNEAEARLSTLRRGNPMEKAFFRNLGDEAWITHSGEAYVRSGNVVVMFVFMLPHTPLDLRQDQNENLKPQQFELEEVEIYNHQLKKFETIQTIKSSRRGYAREIAALVLEFFEKHGN